MDRPDRTQRAFQFLVEGWHRLWIFVSPCLIGLVLAAVAWFDFGGLWKILAPVLAVGGVITGYRLAERAHRGGGAVAFMARLSSSGEGERSAAERDEEQAPPAG